MARCRSMPPRVPDRARSSRRSPAGSRLRRQLARQQRTGSPDVARHRPDAHPIPVLPADICHRRGHDGVDPRPRPAAAGERRCSPAFYDGFRLSGFQSLHGSFATVGAQWAFAPRWQAGVQIADARNVDSPLRQNGNGTDQLDSGIRFAGMERREHATAGQRAGKHANDSVDSINARTASGSTARRYGTAIRTTMASSVSSRASPGATSR